MNSDRQALVLGVVPARATLESAVPRELAAADVLLDGLYGVACAECGGEVLEAPLTGRVFAFAEIDDALRFCRAIQLGLLALEWPDALLRRPECAVVEADGQIAFRGLRVAMAVDVEYPDEVGLHVLSRLAALAAPGRVVLSQRAFDATSVPTHELGAHEHPGLRGHRAVYELAVPGLDRSFGTPGSDPWPVPPQALIGRDGDLQALRELADLGMRVVCVSGDPGVGKSRLLRRFTRDLAREGLQVVAVDLEHALDTWDVLSALARVLALPVREARGPEQLVQRIAATVVGTPGITLVVDHASEPFAVSALRDIVRRAPGSRWILGGPVRLGVAAEVGYVVGALTDHDSGARLFEQTAAALIDGYVVSSGSEALAIATELDGNPLAIEIAASCMPSVRPLALFDRLASGRGPAMRVLDLALALRTEEEVAVLSRLAVFRGPFNVAGAVAVSGSAEPTLDALRRAGLIQVHQPLEAPGALFLRLHPRVREAVLERHPPGDEVFMRLAEWLAARCDDWSQQLWSDRAEAVLARLSLERETLRSVIGHIQERTRLSAVDLTVLAALLEGAVRLAMWEGSVGPLLAPMERALQAVGMCLDADPLVAVRLFRTRGMAREHLGEVEAALADLVRAESLAERWAEPGELATARFHIGCTHFHSRRYDQALGELGGALSGFEEAGMRFQGAQVRAELARASLMTGDLATAESQLDAALQEARGGARWLEATVAEARALLERQLGRPDLARTEYQRALAIWVRIGRWDEAALARLQLALLLQGAGAVEEASVLLVEAESIARLWGDSPRRGVVLTQLGLAWLERGDRMQAHRAFVQAVSACRAGGDRAGQGAAKGFLGLLHHMSGRLDEAREGYRSALRDLESGGDRRYGALFHSCLGAVEAELGNLDEARILVDLAQLQLPDADPGLRDAMFAFHRAIDVARAHAAEGDGDLATAKDLRRGVDDALAELAHRPDNIYLRFARGHLAALVGGTR
ncbi:MAG: hypothetical protein R3F61_34930 [Myxococcota bacterium]